MALLRQRRNVDVEDRKRATRHRVRWQQWEQVGYLVGADVRRLGIQNVKASYVRMLMGDNTTTPQHHNTPENKTMTTPSRAAILTLDELRSQFEMLKAKAESLVITGEISRARAVARQALRARDTAEHFARAEGLTNN